MQGNSNCYVKLLLRLLKLLLGIKAAFSFFLKGCYIPLQVHYAPLYGVKPTKNTLWILNYIDIKTFWG